MRKPKWPMEHFVVELPRLGGRGVLAGNVILTAAHCVHFETNGLMTQGGHFLEEVRTHRGTFHAALIFVEPLSDIAVLGPADNQDLSADAEAFEAFARTGGVRLAASPFRPYTSERVRVLNLNRKWANGTAELYAPPICHVTAEAEIEGGASGGPILNQTGELFAIVSNCGDDPDGFSGTSPHIATALPEWVLRLAYE